MIPLRDANPTHRTPYITIGLIVTNILIFLVELLLESQSALGPFLQQWAVIPAELTTFALGELVMEIGPGLGHLTDRLADKAARVVAVELDNRFIPILTERLAHQDNVDIIHGDILEQDMGALFPTGRYHTIANVPYYITGAILRHLMEASQRPETVVLTVQKEVAQRMSAAPGKMSLMAVNVQRFGKVDFIATIKAGNFWPRPDVDSAIVRVDLSNGPTIPLANDKRFMQIVKAGFAQKRKNATQKSA